MTLFKIDPTTPEGARKAVRTAGIAGFVSAGLTLALIAFARYSQTEVLGGLIGLWSLIDVAIGAALSYGTFRANRFAAVGLLAFYVLNQAVTRIAAGEAGGLWLVVLFVLLFVQGVRGAFTLHRLGQRDPLADQVEAIAAPTSGPSV